MKRTLTFGAGSSIPSSIEEKPKWEETFVLPQGAGWTTKRGTDPYFKDPSYTATRTIAVGVPFSGDLTLKGEKTAKLASNEGIVRPLGDGTFEYAETLKWQGKRDLDALNKAGDALAARARIKAALPPGTPTQKIDEVTNAAGMAAMRSLFGPSDPALDLLLTHREVAFRKIEKQVRLAVRSLVGDDATAAKVARASVESASPKPSEAPEAPSDKLQMDSTKGGPASIAYFVRFPGQILETNGIQEDDGTVMWRFYSEAAAIEDVKLRTVFRP